MAGSDLNSDRYFQGCKSGGRGIWSVYPKKKKNKKNELLMVLRMLTK
jgi:hypothetical protein